MDLRYGLRLLLKNPGSTLVIVLSLAMGIGANTAVFSVANALLLKPFPYPSADRLAVLWLRSPGIGIPQDWPSPGQYLDVQQQNHVFEEMSISQGRSYTLTGIERPERIEGIVTSSSLMHLVGAKPLMGRLLTADDDRSGAPPVLLLTYGLWARLFNSDPAIVGKTITLNGRSFPVAGVLNRDFFLNGEVMPTVGSIDKVEVVISLPLPADAQTKLRGDENYNLMARLKPGVTREQAQRDIDPIAAHIRLADKRDRTFTISVVPLLDQVVGDVRRAVLVLLGSVGLVLVIACANVANLLLTRAASRQKEIAVRTALGAGAGRVVRQLLTESVLLSLLGGIAGVAVAAASLQVVRSINPGNIPRLESIALDGRVLAFTFAVSILTGVIFGLAPALRAARIDLNSALKAGGRSSQGDGGFRLSRHRLRGLLVASELAFSMMLLIGAGLLVRSFLRLSDVPPGFNPDRVISARLALTGPKYQDNNVVGRAFRELVDRVEHLPGVKAAGAVAVLPFSNAISWGGVQVEGYLPPPNEPELQADQRPATPGYFHTMEIPLLAGRFFTEADTPDAPPVVIVDAKMAQRFWPKGDAVGKRMRAGSRSKWATVVGVVGTVKQYALDQDLRPVMYSPHAQVPWNGMYLVARAAGDPGAMVNLMAREVRATEPSAPLFEVNTMERRIYRSLARQRFAMTMLAAFAAFAMLLGAVGIYGVMSYLVTQGTHDLGVRLALGAPRASILRMVVRQGMAVAGAGMLAGLAGAMALTRVMDSLLFGVGARDAATFAAVAALLGLVALTATYLPAWRATRVDPLSALREE
jgi:predicted permease